MRYVALLLVGPLILFFAGCAAYIPTGSYKEEKVLATRVATDGTFIERIIETRVTGKRFYPATVEGPFVSTSGESRYHYALRHADGSERKLGFLDKTEPYEELFAFSPLPRGRWLALSTVANAKPYVEEAGTVEVVVFDSERVYFKMRVAGCYRNPGHGISGALKWRPLSPEIPSYGLNYSIDAANGLVTFRTYLGDFMFNASDGSLRRTNGASQTLQPAPGS
jgi:hypothetical protein